MPIQLMVFKRIELITLAYQANTLPFKLKNQILLLLSFN